MNSIRMILAIIVALSSGKVWAQGAPGVIQGTALTAAGKPLPRAQLYYGRTGAAKAKASGSVLSPILSAKAGLDGSFTLANLPPGSWTICAEAAGYLNPCHWSTAPVFAVGAGQTISNATVHLDQAYTLHIRVDDPQGFLANEGSVAGAVLHLGVHSPSGAFHHATLASKSGKARDYTVQIPLRATSKVFVSGGAFQMNDDAGVQVSNGGKLAQVTGPDVDQSGKTGVVAPLHFTVTGIVKP